MTLVILIIVQILSVNSIFNIPENTDKCEYWMESNSNSRILCESTLVADASNMIVKSWLTSSPTRFNDDVPAIGGNIPLELFSIKDLTSLNLVESELTGVIPSEVGTFNIKILKLNLNQLSGNIPPEIGNITSLEVLDLSNNLLSGNIPSELGNLKNLKQLKLNNNYLTGSIPPELALLGLTDLNLDKNDLEGKVPQFSIFSQDGEHHCKLDNPRLLCPFPGSCSPSCSKVNCINSDCPCQLNGQEKCIETTVVLPQITSEVKIETTIESAFVSTTLVNPVITSTFKPETTSKSENLDLSEENSSELLEDSDDEFILFVIIGFPFLAISIIAILIFIIFRNRNTHKKDIELAQNKQNIPESNLPPYYAPNHVQSPYINANSGD